METKEVLQQWTFWANLKYGKKEKNGKSAEKVESENKRRRTSSPRLSMRSGTRLNGGDYELPPPLPPLCRFYQPGSSFPFSLSSYSYSASSSSFFFSSLKIVHSDFSQPSPHFFFLRHAAPSCVFSCSTPPYFFVFQHSLHCYLEFRKINIHLAHLPSG